MKKRIAVNKTYKLFIGGQFVRSESGHYFRDGEDNVSRASRKDLRDAVTAARKTFSGWSGKTAYNRGQILYRIAEELESRKSEFSNWAILAEVEKAVDRLVWYAGWTDKYTQIFGTVNPVALPYFNFTMPEATGVVGIILQGDLPLLPLISTMAPAIAGGNTCILLTGEKYSQSAITFAEVLASSDVPGGVVNILTGPQAELISQMAKHMDVNAIAYNGTSKEVLRTLQEEGAANVKRIISRPQPSGKQWFQDKKAQSPYWIQETIEMKTTWHPVGV